MNTTTNSSPETNPCTTASPWLTEHATAELVHLLKAHNHWQANETLQQLHRAGQGNMNLTLRVTTNQRRFILKQARPWVEKYPSIAAPLSRHDHERRFYEVASVNPTLRASLPELLGCIPTAFVLLLEDLGPASDWSSLYGERAPGEPLLAALRAIIPWLYELQAVEVKDEQRPQFRNSELRALNHAHIFEVPYQIPPVIDLDAITRGLASLAPPLHTHSQLQQQLSQLGQLYLSDGLTLLHGDLFPGSWLNTPHGLRIIDPEFCFCGPPEFDWAILLAHSQLLQCEEEASSLLQPACMQARRPVDWQLVEQFAAAEVLRRLLGVAQLPLQLDLAAKKQLIEAAVSTLTAGNHR